MRVLIIQSDGEHKGQDGWTPNWYLRECYALAHAFQMNGHEAEIWGKRHDNFKVKPDFESYDLLFIIENYEFEWIPDLSKIKTPKCQWIIDLHCQSSAIYRKLSKHCDYILHSTKRLMPEYSKGLQNKKHIWFPNGIDDRHFYPRGIVRHIDTLFVGSKNAHRIKDIEYMEQYGMRYRFATGQDMINAISSTKIHFNKNIGVDINYRTFETIGLGACLLTNYDKDLEILGFKHGYNCLLYGNIKEAKDLAKEYIKNGQWLTIANKGVELAKEHSYINRIDHLIEQIQ